jgi:putative salt-induced outer membrane protein YdiY
MAPQIMKTIRNLVVAVGFLAAFCSTSPAQTNVVTETNVVTVLVTNVVNITNVVAAVPVPAPAPVVATVKNPWLSSVSAGLTLTRGNKDTTLFTADFLTGKKAEKNEYSFGLGVAYGSQDSSETVNSYKAFGQWNHLFTDRFFGYVRADGLRDIIADLDYRLSIGPGAGYYLLKETNTTLALEAGAGMEFQKLGGKDDQFATIRFAERFEHKFNGRARLWQSLDFQPQVDKFDNYVVNFEIGVEAAISKSFSLKAYLDDTYVKIPAAGRKQNDIKLVAGVSYKF